MNHPLAEFARLIDETATDVRQATASITVPRGSFCERTITIGFDGGETCHRAEVNYFYEAPQRGAFDCPPTDGWVEILAVRVMGLDLLPLLDKENVEALAESIKGGCE